MKRVSKRISIPSERFYQLGTFLGAGFLWEICYQVGLIDPRYLPSAHEVIVAIAQLFTQHEFMQLLLATLSSYAWGLLAATILGVLGGILVSYSRILRTLVSPFIEFLRPMPSIAIIPLAILILGLGLRMEVIVIMYGAVWPVFISTIYGIDHVDNELIEVANIFKLGRKDTWLKVVIPASSSYIITGLRTASGIALLLAVSTEMVAGGNGVGSFLSDVQFSFNLPHMYAAIVSIGVLGFFLNEIFRFLEIKLMAWRPKNMED